METPRNAGDPECRPIHKNRCCFPVSCRCCLLPRRFRSAGGNEARSMLRFRLLSGASGCFYVAPLCSRLARKPSCSDVRFLCRIHIYMTICPASNPCAFRRDSASSSLSVSRYWPQSLLPGLQNGYNGMTGGAASLFFMEYAHWAACCWNIGRLS